MRTFQGLLLGGVAALALLVVSPNTAAAQWAYRGYCGSPYYGSVYYGPHYRPYAYPRVYSHGYSYRYRAVPYVSRYSYRSYYAPRVGVHVGPMTFGWGW